MKLATLTYLVIRDESGTIQKVCLAEKKYGGAKGKWNGAGGKVEKGETIEEAAIRETREEIGVSVLKMNKVAELEFSFDQETERNMFVHAFLVDEWQGDPTESNEMRPAWFAVEEIPYEKMWPVDQHWMPRTFRGEILTGRFLYSNNDELLSIEMNNIATF